MIFETPRLVARRFDPRDLAAFTAMRADADVARFQSWESFDESAGRDFLNDMSARNPGDPGWFQFALVWRGTGDFIGDCGLRIVESDRRLAQVGYTITKAHWHKGLASEAVAALTQYAFVTFPIHRITASVDPRNYASCRVLEKCGYVKEAHLRQSEWFKGEWADDVVYARLRSDPPCDTNPSL